MLPDLPQELIECVLNYLSHRSKYMRSCSLVCRAWVPFCTRYLFRHLRLNWSKEGLSQGTSSDAFLRFQDQSPALCSLVRSLTITGSSCYARSPDISLGEFAILVDNLKNLRDLHLSLVIVSINSPFQPTTNCHLERLSVRWLRLKYSSGTQSDNDDEWVPITHPLTSFLRIFSGIDLLTVGKGYTKPNLLTGRSLEIIDQTLLSSEKGGITRLELDMGFLCDNTEGTIALLECLDLSRLEYVCALQAHTWIQAKAMNYVAEHSLNLTHVVIQIPSFAPLDEETSWISSKLHMAITIIPRLIRTPNS
ncbi:hypothetical protein NLI96_g1192 [Meripilus lineatus]|uniref:F-box domain-containing protein n=1 Tax=Meripilus lineatus TaxID=2056292 RepID=A0AAD5VAN0_9APHY|nr:hypothetical protein NLI96_g1192 [Physisporinus lineatus]